MVLSAKAKYPPALTNDEAVDFLLEHEARNGGGLLDWNEAKQIANAANVWTLTQVPVEQLPGRSYFPARSNRRRRMPGFALDLGGGMWEILDGRHRVSEARFYKDATIPMYVAKV